MCALPMHDTMGSVLVARDKKVVQYSFHAVLLDISSVSPLLSLLPCLCHFENAVPLLVPS
jgi:hypothetical protein